MAALQTKLPHVLLLGDPQLRTLAAWGVVFPNGEHPIPSTFVVGRDGVVRWRYFYQRGGDWPPYRVLSAAL